MDTLAVHTFDECLHVDMDNTPGSPYPPGNVSPIAAGTFESMIFLSYKYGEICDRSLEGTLHPKKSWKWKTFPGDKPFIFQGFIIGARVSLSILWLL